MNALAAPPVTIREAPFDALAALHARIPEFAGPNAVPDAVPDAAPSEAQEQQAAPHASPENAAWFAARCAGRDPLALIAQINGRDMGYMVSYDKYRDGSYYCWMAAVAPEARRRGVLTALMHVTRTAARDRGYDAIRIKTRNNRREMLAWLVAQGFDFLSVDPRTPREDSRIALILPLHDARVTEKKDANR